MSGTGYDPDFVITISGQDVTKYVFQWKLTDDEKKSSLQVHLRNPDQVLSGQFDTGQEVTIIFGYVGNQGENITMTIKVLEESYSVDTNHDFISVLGKDCLSCKGGSKSAGSGGNKVSKPPAQ